MSFKRIASKNKNPTRERGETSNLQPENNQPSAEKREFLASELSRLANRFSMLEIHWFMHNNDTKVKDFVDKILISEENRTPSPKKELPDNYLDDLLRDDYQREADSDPEDEIISLCYCVTCDDFSLKEEMVRCRKCGYWYHTWCIGEPDQEGRYDPNFSFCLCPKCKSNPKQDSGYKFTYKSKADMEADKHYEDTDSDLEPDL